MPISNFSDITGLLLVLRADQGLFTDTAGTTPVSSDGDAVARWEDQSGNANHFTQNTAANRPLYKLNIGGQAQSVQFDGSNDLLDRGSSITPTGGMTAYVLIRRDGIDGTYGYSITVPGATGQFFWRLGGSAKQQAVKDSVADIGYGSGTPTNLTWVQLNVTWSGTAGSFRQAGAGDGSISYGSSVTPTVRYLGYDAPGGAPYSVLKGQLWCVVVYQGVHDDATRSDVETYISAIANGAVTSIRVTRQSVEAAQQSAFTPTNLRVTRQSVEAAQYADFAASNIRATRQSVEAAQWQPYTLNNVRISRQSVEVAQFAAFPANEARLTQQTVEVLYLEPPAETTHDQDCFSRMRRL